MARPKNTSNSTTEKSSVEKPISIGQLAYPSNVLCGSCMMVMHINRDKKAATCGNLTCANNRIEYKLPSFILEKA